MLNRLQDVFRSFQQHEVKYYQGQEFFIVSKEDLIASKRAAGRDVDIEDVRLLEIPEDGETEQEPERDK